MPGSHSSSQDTRPQAQSTPDEITPIADAEQAAGRNYNTTEPQSPRLSVKSGRGADEEENVDLPKSGSKSGLRQRRDVPEDRGTREIAGPRHEDEGFTKWWKGFVDKYGSVELDNKGSVARDHLALERTFLAWLRTSLAFASIGIAVTQLFRLNTTITDREGLTPTPDPPGTVRLRQVGKPLGATFLGIAVLVLMVGGRRYFESQYWIIRGKFPASRGSVFLISLVALALIVTSLVVVCTVDPSQFTNQ